DKSKVLESVRQLHQGLVSSDNPRDRVKGHYGNEIVTIRMKIKSHNEAEKFFASLWRRLPDCDREQILTNLSGHTDPSGTLYLRIDKEECYRGRIRIGKMDTIRIETHFSFDHSTPKAMLADIERRVKQIPEEETEPELLWK